jgi:hypothetical protein
VNSIHWDIGAGTLKAILTADNAQTIALVMPPGATVTSLTVNGKAEKVTEQGVNKQGCALSLPKGKPVTVEARFHHTAQDGEPQVQVERTIILEWNPTTR